MDIDKNENRQKRIEEYLLDPDKVIFEEITKFDDAIKVLISELQKIPADVDALKGEDGKTPVKGVDYLTDEEINGLENFILTRLPEAGKDYPTIQQAREIIEETIAKIPKPEDGKDGKKGEKGEKGKDGSPDTPEEIRLKLKTILKGNKRWGIGEVKGLKKIAQRVNENTDDIEALTKKVDEQMIVFPTGVGGIGGSKLTITEEDGSPSYTTGTLKFPDGTVTSNPDGSVSIASGSNNVVKKISSFTVTTDFAENEIIDIITGVGNISGVSTREISATGGVDSLGVDSNTFIKSVETIIYRNGQRIKKGHDVIWDSETTLHFIKPLEIDEYIEIEQLVQGLVAIDRTESIINVDTTAYSLQSTDDILHVTHTTTAPVTITLPTIQMLAGRIIHIKDGGLNASTNYITIETEGTELIDGDINFVLSGDGESISIYCDGSNWFIY